MLHIGACSGCAQQGYVLAAPLTESHTVQAEAFGEGLCTEQTYSPLSPPSSPLNVFAQCSYPFLSRIEQNRSKCSFVFVQRVSISSSTCETSSVLPWILAYSTSVSGNVQSSGRKFLTWIPVLSFWWCFLSDCFHVGMDNIAISSAMSSEHWQVTKVPEAGRVTTLDKCQAVYITHMKWPNSSFISKNSLILDAIHHVFNLYRSLWNFEHNKWKVIVTSVRAMWLHHQLGGVSSVNVARFSTSLIRTDTIHTFWL